MGLKYMCSCDEDYEDNQLKSDQNGIEMNVIVYVS